MPTLKIDGREVTVEKDTLIIEACRQLGIYVPHFCYHPGLSIAGQCRLCLVEVNKGSKLVPGCQIPCAEGQEVVTTNAAVTEARRAMMELHLINHPVDCPICDKAGECTLQDYYMAYDLKESRLQFRKVGKSKVVPIGPRVVYDGERCVMCTRCVRFTHEVSHSGQLAVAARGDRSYISTMPGRQLDDDYSLCTVDVCPVGALTSRDFRFQRRVWFMKAFASVCQGCATGCNIEVQEADNTVHRLMPRVNMAVNQYWMCDEGRGTYRDMKEGRLTRAVLKDGPSPAALETAVTQVATRLGELVRAGAQSTLGVVLSPRATTEENFALARLASEFLGTRAIYVGQGRPAWRADTVLRNADNNPNRAGAEAVRAWATGGAPGDLFADLTQGKVKSLIVLGGDWPWALPGGATQPDSAALNLLGRLELLVVISPSETHLTRLAHQVLPQAHPYELDGTFINAKGTVQRLRPAVRPAGDAQPTWKLVTQLARKMELALEFTSALATFTDAASRALGDKVPDAAQAYGPELPARVISGSPIHEAPEEPFEVIVGHQPPAAMPVPVYAGYHGFQK